MFHLFISFSLFCCFCSGHRAPELKKKILSTNADVYSFGVLILELVTGQKNSSFPSGLIAHVGILITYFKKL